jgi:hypothetical protein
MSDPTDVDDDDTLDGICDLDAPMGPPTPDHLVPWVVLFATVIDHDHRVANARRALELAGEWRALFGDAGVSTP